MGNVMDLARIFFMALAMLLFAWVLIGALTWLLLEWLDSHATRPVKMRLADIAHPVRLTLPFRGSHP